MTKASLKLGLWSMALSLAVTGWCAGSGAAGQGKEVYPGVWRFTLGTPEKITPVSTRYYAPAGKGLAELAAAGACPAQPVGTGSERGYLVSLPLQPDEMIYGLGLQFRSFQQRGLKKQLRVNADPTLDTGDSHAPVPFYVTTRGYGVLIDTARYATFYCGSTQPKPLSREKPADDSYNDGWNGPTTPYERHRLGGEGEILVEVPEARGVDVYIFAGPTLRLAVQRYNLFSGGGPLPPRWGLGFWYRCQSDFDQAGVLGMASGLRERRIPCDVLGLEPHWQSHSYSCSYVWSTNFPDPGAMVAQLGQERYHVNLWEHAFTHPSSPIYGALQPYSGDHGVWGGLVPDFLSSKARELFANYHDREHVAIGVSGYKLDECDNSDFTGGWSFPEVSRFPSGADGEQMHSLFGLRYQDTIQGVFEKRKLRTYGLVRSSQALAAPYPYALYSDLYDHRQFIHGVAQAGFSGLLWTPEVRDSKNAEDLIRRLQTTVFSPLAIVNAWYLKNPPWKQVDRRANNAGQFAPNWEELEAQCRAVIELRMKFVPYLHAAFVRYHREGLPPFRALVMDYPEDQEARTIDNEYLMGESMLVAPVVAGESQRSVYLPEGEWCDFWTGTRYAGKERIPVRPPLNQIPLFVKAGTVLPLAQPTLSTEDPDSWKLTAMIYGDGSKPATLFEDDGSFEPKLVEVRLVWDGSSHSGKVIRAAPGGALKYEAVAWQSIP